MTAESAASPTSGPVRGAPAGPYAQYEDPTAPVRGVLRAEQHSAHRDLIFYDSSVTPGLRLAALVTRPARPGPILASTHGWHGHLPAYAPLDAPPTGPSSDYLRVEVDMRGRAHSTGSPDCNGWEIHDVIDAVNAVRARYADLILDPGAVYFEAGSGGGGNALALAAKFPDFFAAVTALCPISDYAQWYRDDAVGEFRDEMDVWIGAGPDEAPDAYRARSGLDLVSNVRTPMLLIHGDRDVRVPVTHSRRYAAAGRGVRYVELAGVGGARHWDNASDDQVAAIGEAAESHRRAHPRPVALPDRGSLLVGGYVRTRRFFVRLDSLDAIARIDYDLGRGVVAVEPEFANRAVVAWL